MSETISNRVRVKWIGLLLIGSMLLLESCKDKKNNTAPVVKFTGIAAAFNDNQEALKYTLTILVDQPGAGGDAETWEVVGFLDIDPGHAFVKLERLNVDSTKTTIYVGFYPDKLPNDPNQLETKGELRDDSAHVYEVSKEYILTKVNFDKALAYIESVESSKKKYHLNDYNCADFAIQTGKAAGENIPDTHGTWDVHMPGIVRVQGGGSNPGNLGQDLR